jgi:hypothetical protein
MLGLVAGILGAVVFIWEIPFIGSKTSLWQVIVLLSLAVVLLAVNQVRHGG